MRLTVSLIKNRIMGSKENSEKFLLAFIEKKIPGQASFKTHHLPRRTVAKRRSLRVIPLRWHRGQTHKLTSSCKAGKKRLGKTEEAQMLGKPKVAWKREKRKMGGLTFQFRRQADI